MLVAADPLIEWVGGPSNKLENWNPFRNQITDCIKILYSLLGMTSKFEGNELSLQYIGQGQRSGSRSWVKVKGDECSKEQRRVIISLRCLFVE